MNTQSYGKSNTPFLILAIDTGSSDENSKQNLMLYPGDDVRIKATEFCVRYNLSQEAVPIIINHVKDVLIQHQIKIDQENSTPSWQQSSMAQQDDSKNVQSQMEDERRQDSMNNYSTKNSNKDTPSSLFGSSEKKQKFMATINEDIFESQHNSSIKMTRNNEDLKDVTDVRTANKKSFSDFSSLSNINTDNKEFSWSKTYRSPVNIKSNCKDNKKEIKHSKLSKIDYANLTKTLQNSCSTHKICSKQKGKDFKREINRNPSKSKSKKRTSTNGYGKTVTSVKNIFTNSRNSKDLQYNANPGERSYVRQTNQKKVSYRSLLK